MKGEGAGGSSSSPFAQSIGLQGDCLLSKRIEPLCLTLLVGYAPVVSILGRPLRTRAVWLADCITLAVVTLPRSIFLQVYLTNKVKISSKRLSSELRLNSTFSIILVCDPDIVFALANAVFL